MKKNQEHGYQCDCQQCKPLKVTDPSTEDTGEWPALKLVPDTRPMPQGESGCA